MRPVGAVTSRERLRNEIWGLGFDPGTKVAEVLVRYLRRKVGEGEARPVICTARGVGYAVRGWSPGDRDEAG